MNCALNFDPSQQKGKTSSNFGRTIKYLIVYSAYPHWKGSSRTGKGQRVCCNNTPKNTRHVVNELGFDALSSDKPEMGHLIFMVLSYSLNIKATSNQQTCCSSGQWYMPFILHMIHSWPGSAQIQLRLIIIANQRDYVHFSLALILWD